MSAEVYSQRFNLLEKQRTYRLDEDAIVWEDVDGGSGRMAYGDITQVRLSSWPDVQAGTIYAILTPRHGTTLKLSNRSYVSPGNFDMQQEAFAAFLQTLHVKLGEYADGVRYRLGATTAGYVATIVFCAALFVFIAGTLYAILAEASVLIGLISVVIMLSFVPWLVRFLLAAKPDNYSPEDICGT